MIARIHTAVVPVRRMIHGLLIRIGRHHPQAGQSLTLVLSNWTAVRACVNQLQGFARLLVWVSVTPGVRTTLHDCEAGQPWRNLMCCS